MSSMLRGNNTPIIDQLPRTPHWLIEAYDTITGRRLDSSALDGICDKYQFDDNERKMIFLEVK